MDWAVATLIPDPRFLGSQNPSARYAQRYGLGMVIYASLSFEPAVACGIMVLPTPRGSLDFWAKKTGGSHPRPSGACFRCCSGQSLCNANGSNDSPHGVKCLPA